MTTAGPALDRPTPAATLGGAVVMARYGLRSHRWALAGAACLGFISPYSAGASYAAAAGTAALRASFGRQTAALGPQLAYLVPLPIHPNTVAGYVWWKGLTWMSLVFAAWGLAAATGLIRNEEERGLLETWLASPLGRGRLLLSRSVAFAVTAAAAVVVTGLGTAAGVAAGKGTVGLTALWEQAAPLLGITLVAFAIGLAAAQLTVTRRAAVMLGGLVLIVLYGIDASARVNSRLAGWAVISPFHLADLTTAVVPGGRFDGAATISLYGIAAALVALSTVGFRRRDLWSSVLRRREVDSHVSRGSSANPLLRVPVLRSLWQQRAGLIGWLLGSMMGAALVVSLAHGAGKLLTSTHGFSGYLRAAGTGNPATAVVGSIWLSIAALTVAAYAITQASHWASDDAGGRVEMEIAQPVPRWSVVLERGLALAVASLVISALGAVVVAAVAPSQGVHLGGGRLVIATGLLVLLALSFGALGALAIARFPRVTVPLLAAIAVVSFYIPLLAPLFKWPGWTLDISLFHLYGQPLTSGLYWTGLWIMAAIVVVGLGGAVAAMRVRDLGR
ncbi:MAG: ABC transporter permease subunit [Candidatus Dormibacteria bacterium]